jgi:colicin import membrane protein
MPSLLSRSLIIGFLLWPSFGATGNAADPKRARRLDEQREDAAVRKAQQELNAAQQDVREAEQSLLKAQAAFRKAETERKGVGIALQKTIDDLEEKHAVSAGLTTARDQLKEARAAFAEAASPILASVRQSTAYQAAEKDLAAATAALEPETEGDREEAARKAAAARAAMRDLERAATADDPRLKPIDARAEAAEEKLKAAQTQFEKAVEKDTALKNARNAFAAAKAAEKKAEAVLVRDNRGLLTARSKLARAQQSLQAKKITDQRDANKAPQKVKPKGK